jgi:hypothetical protein
MLLALAHMEHQLSPTTIVNAISSKRSTTDGDDWKRIRVNITWPASLPIANAPQHGQYGVFQATPVWDQKAGSLRLLFQVRNTTPGCCPCSNTASGFGTEALRHCCVCQTSRVYVTQSTDMGMSYAEPKLAFPVKASDGTEIDWSLGGQQATQLRSDRIVVGGYAVWDSAGAPGTKGGPSTGGIEMLDRATALYSDDGQAPNLQVPNLEVPHRYANMVRLCLCSVAVLATKKR